MALLSGVVLAFHLAVLPALPVANSATLRQFGEQLANRKLQVGLMLTLLLMTPMLFLTVGGSNLGGGVALLAWGLAYGGVSVGLMTWMMHAAPRAIEIATALYVGAFNIGIALGSWSGGQVVDGFGVIANLWLAGGFAGTALLLILGVGLCDRRRDDALRPMPTDPY